jgi:opine dehydrogenase
MAMRVAIMGAGAGGSAATVELSLAGHSVALWSRSPQTLLPLERAGGLGYRGVLGEGRIAPDLLTSDACAAVCGADAVLVCLPTTSHREIAQTLARADLAHRLPVVLDPGHTGGALEFAQVYREACAQVPPVAELSTLTYVARKYTPETVTIMSCARTVRAAALPGGETALAAARTLFRSVQGVADVLASDLSNVNMVLHPPGAVLGAAWVEARRGDFTFYVEGMTKGVGRVLSALDEERRAVARAFGHDLPTLIEEMKAIGTVEAACPDNSEPACAISGGEANRHIKAPDSLEHRYYQEDFGHGLLPFCELAAIARVPVPIAQALLRLGSCLTGVDFTTRGRTAARMGIAGFTAAQLIAYVRG